MTGTNKRGLSGSQKAIVEEAFTLKMKSSIFLVWCGVIDLSSVYLSGKGATLFCCCNG